MKTSLMIVERERIQKVMVETFQSELQLLNHDMQSILIDDMITAFFNRLSVLKKTQTEH